MGTLRTTIAIVIVLLSVVNSSKVKFNENDLKQLQKALYESAHYMRQEVKNEDVAICIGATRAGKSTLINYLIGNKLKAVRYSRFSPITIEKADIQSIGPDIGRGTTSKTTIPTKWVSKDFHDLIIWDAPGFDDNRGPVQDITNAFYLHQLVQNVKSLKIILAVDINDILHDNIKPFVSVLNAVENLLGEKMKDYFDSITVIFTKVPNTLHDIPVNMEFISEQLKLQFLNSTDMDLSKVSTEFAEYLVRNNNRIGFFKRPVNLDEITSSVDVNIFPALRNSSSIQKNHLQQLSPSISESSTLCLFGIRERLFSTSPLNELGKAISFVCEKKAKDTSILSNKEEAENDLRELNKELNNIEDKLFNATFYENDFCKKIEILETIDVSIKNKIEETNILELIKLMEFVDKLLNLEESRILANKLQGILMASSAKVKEASSSILLKLGEITQQKYEEMMISEREAHSKQIIELNKRLKEMEEKNSEQKSAWEHALKLAPYVIKLVKIMKNRGEIEDEP